MPARDLFVRYGELTMMMTMTMMMTTVLTQLAMKRGREGEES